MLKQMLKEVAKRTGADIKATHYTDPAFHDILEVTMTHPLDASQVKFSVMITPSDTLENVRTYLLEEWKIYDDRHTSEWFAEHSEYDSF